MISAFALSVLVALAGEGEVRAARIAARASLKASEAAVSAQKASEAAITAQKATAGSEWLLQRKKWCIGSEAELSCDETSIIKLVSAFYARLPRVDGVACAPKSGGEESCEPNVTDGVLDLCKGKRQCTVPPSFHPSCATVTAIRIVWDCVTGAPETAEQDIKFTPIQEVPVREEREEIPQPKPEDDEDDDMPELPEEKEMPVQLPQSGQAGPGRKFPGGAAPGEEEDDDELVTGELPNKRMDELEKEAEKLKGEPGLKVDFNPCFRQKGFLRRLGIFWRSTTCPRNEGCFKLHWDDGRAYTDPETPPSQEELLQGSLVQGEDSWWVTFNTIGLQRNDYNTWGVCLPKSEPEGKFYATAVFNSLKHH